MWIFVPKSLIHDVALAKLDPTPLLSQMFSLLLGNSFLRWKIASKSEVSALLQFCCLPSYFSFDSLW